MQTTITRVEKVEFSKVRKNVIEETGKVFYVRDIDIRSDKEKLTVTIFADSPDKLVQKRGKNEKNS